MMKIFSWIFMGALWLQVPYAVNAQGIPSILFENQHDYSFMWWKKTIKTGNKVFAIKTNHYTLSFDYPSLAIESLDINRAPTAEGEVLKESNDESFPQNIEVDFNFGMDMDGTMHWSKTTSRNIDDCQLIETGKYFQHRFINHLRDLQGCDQKMSGLEVYSWPDRLSFVLRALPERNIEKAGLRMEMGFPAVYSEVIQSGGLIGLKNPNDGSGYVVLKSAGASSLSVNGTVVRSILDNKELVSKGEEMNVGLIIYPIASDIDARIVEIDQEINQPVSVKAQQFVPGNQQLTVLYDKDIGWHEIGLRNDGNTADYSQSSNDRIERVNLTFENTAAEDRIVRLNFSKGLGTLTGASVFGVTGISAVFRDDTGNPIGIPIQLSKNWHTATDDRYKGTWYRGLSTMTIPANSTVNLEYTSVSAMWGTLPAASHAQLCLVGWGSNQQWDESAIGSWGETITYEPDLDQAGAPVLDYRSLMIKNLEGGEWGWTGNMGGADFFNCTSSSGNRKWHSRMRTRYKRYSPNFTEVTYAGTLDDQSIDLEYTASIGRSNDITRGIYKIRMDVRENTTFEDFVFFQTAAKTYHYVKSATLAYGNEEGLKDSWTATISSSDSYNTAKKVVEGDVPWFSMTDSDFSSGSNQFRPANRGFVIRNWNARIQGQDNIPPYYAEYSATKGHGSTSGLINITTKEGVTSFRQGDYVEALIEIFQVPKNADDYYGPNTGLSQALMDKANTWEMAYREAIGNNIKVEVTLGGKVIADYPIKIDVAQTPVHFSVTGGIAQVPLTFTSVKDYRAPVLGVKYGNTWYKVNQEVHGNDYWQADYNQINSTWDITFNINLDSQGEQPKQWEFVFGNPDIQDMILGTGQEVRDFVVYPNPTSNGSFRIDGVELSEGLTSVEVIDMYGKTVLKNAFKEKDNIDLGCSLPKGVYMLKLVNKEGNFSRKLIVE